MVDHGADDTGDQSTDRRFTPPETDERRRQIDELLGLLGHRRRRDVLYYLADNDLASVDTLATAIASREFDLPAESVPAERRDPVLIDLYHNHLPKLTDRRLIEYDRRSGAVRWAEPPKRLAELLECCHALETDVE